MSVNLNPKPPRGRDRPSRKAEQSEATRAELVRAARSLFGRRGYAAVGTEAIVRAAGVTRGALYHHSGGKRDLLEAVYRDVEEDLTKEIAEQTLGSGASSPMAAMRAGTVRFLDACAEPEVQRIVLLDAPAVLGWDRWREIAAEYGLGLIEANLEAAMEAGEIDRRPVGPLAHLLMGALDEAAMLVARSPDEQTRAEVEGVLDLLLGSLGPGSPR